MNSFALLPAAERFNLAALAAAFAIGILTIVYFTLTYSARKKDADRTRGGTFITARFFREYFFFLTAPLITFFLRLGLSPNQISALSLFLSLVAAGCIYSGHLFWGGWAIAFSGVVDTIDGEIARRTGRASKQGAFLDSVFDRYADNAIFISLAAYFALAFSAGSYAAGFWYALLSLLSLSGAALISYSKERGANLGAQDTRGLMQRADRLVILCVMCIYDPAAFWLQRSFTGSQQNEHLLSLLGLAAMGVISHLSAAGRIFRLARTLKRV